VTLRKGEITLPEIKRKWTHHVALATDKVRGVKNSQIPGALQGTLRATTIYFLSTGNLTTICFLHFRKKLGLPCAENITETQNGLTCRWHGRVWLNPPFDRYKVGRWIGRIADHGNGTALLDARTETEWFRVCWQHATAPSSSWRSALSS